MPNDERKGHAHRKGRLFGSFFIVAILVVLVFLGIRFFAGPKTMVLTESVPVTVQESGRGAFFFHLYAPEAFYDVEKGDWDASLRYRVGSRIASLNDTLRDRLMAWEKDNPSAQEQAYIDRMLADGAIVMPFSGMVRLGRALSLYTADALEGLSPGDLGAQAASGDVSKGLTFIDNRLFYCALDLPQTTRPLSVDVGEAVTLVDRKGNTWQATVEEIKTAASGRLIVCALRDGLNRIATVGPMDLILQKEVRESFSVPLEALMTAGEQVFCYILDEDHVARRVAVQMMRVDEATHSAWIAPVAAADAEEITLSRYDHVILKPDEVKEGAVYAWD